MSSHLETFLLLLWEFLFYLVSAVVLIVLITPIVYYSYIYIENE